MVRFILKRKVCNSVIECENFETIDCEIPELEEKLTQGGYGEQGFDVTNLIGYEVIQKG